VRSIHSTTAILFAGLALLAPVAASAGEPASVVPEPTGAALFAAGAAAVAVALRLRKSR
jgi:hypothetical protein